MSSHQIPSPETAQNEPGTLAEGLSERSEDAPAPEQKAPVRQKLASFLGRIAHATDPRPEAIVGRQVEKDLANMDSAAEQAAEAPYWKTPGVKRTFHEVIRREPARGSTSYDNPNAVQVSRGHQQRDASMTSVVRGIHEVQEKRPPKLSTRIADKLALGGEGRQDQLAQNAHNLTKRMLRTESTEPVVHESPDSQAAKRQERARAKWEAVLDVRNILELRERIITNAVNEGIREQDAVAFVQSGSLIKLPARDVAAYLGVKPEQWSKQRRGEKGVVPADVIQLLNQIISLPGLALDSLVEQRYPGTKVERGKATGKHMDINDSSATETRDLTPIKRLKSLDSKFRGKDQKGIDRQVAAARAAVEPYNAIAFAHQQRLERITHKTERAKSALGRLAERGWPMVKKYSPREVEMLLDVDLKVQSEIKDRVSRGEFDEQADDFGDLCTDVRREIYRQKLVPSLTDEKIDEIYGDVKAMKRNELEINDVIERAGLLIIDSQFGSEWLIRKEIKLERTIKDTKENSHRAGEVDLTEAQTEYIMQVLEDEGIVGPERRGPDGNKQRRDVLVDQNGNPK